MMPATTAQALEAARGTRLGASMAALAFCSA